MAKSFSELRSQTSNIEKVAKQLQDSEKKNFEVDTRFWKAALDKAGNGSAVIRFLDAPKDEDSVFVQYYEHFFKGPGGQSFVEMCPTSLGRDCPVCEDNGRHWKEGEAGEAFVRERKSSRQSHYITNVLVIEDPANPENEGKVFLFKYGVKLHQKIKDAIVPPFKGVEGYIPYDMYQGANFNLRITRVKGNGKDSKGYADFAQSNFDSNRGPIDGGDAVLEAIWNSQYSLKEFVDPAKFKSYEDLAKKLDKVLTGTSSSARTIEQSLQQETATAPTKTVTPPTTTRKPPSATKAHKAPEPEKIADVSGGDDGIESLRDLLADD
jgi:hypothetical protein